MNVPAIEAVVEHVARTAKAYISAATTAIALVLQSQIHLSQTAHTWLAVALVVGSYIVTFVVPNKASGITLGQAVAADGPLFQQAAEALKSLPLPGPAAQIIGQVEAAAPQVEAIAEQVEPAIEAAVDSTTVQSLTPSAAQ